MKKLNYIFLTLACSFFQAQVLITAGNTASPSPNRDAALELYSQNSNKGLLMPKVALVATDNPSPLPSHIAGITVYNTATATATALTSITPGFYYNDGTSWSKLEVQLPTVGDIKYSSTAADHEGWYLLNGRATSTLPIAAQTNATSLGFSAAIPDSSDRFLKSKSATETLGAIGGNSSATLLRANLPNTVYNATTTSAGLHAHGYNDRASGTTTSIEVGSTKTVVDNDSTTSTTGSAGAHTHTYNLSTGGSSTPLNLQPKYLSAYIFVYLGQ